MVHTVPIAHFMRPVHAGIQLPGLWSLLNLADTECLLLIWFGYLPYQASPNTIKSANIASTVLYMKVKKKLGSSSIKII